MNRVYDDFSGIVLTLARGGYLWILFEIQVDDPAFCSRNVMEMRPFQSGGAYAAGWTRNRAKFGTRTT